MNPTVKTFFLAIGNLCIALLRFTVATFLALAKLLNVICEFLIDGAEQILNRLKPC